jgi:hypothetical protein
MAYFVQMMEKAGVYPAENFMIVPRGGFNLCYLRDGKDYRISHDARLDVHEVKFDEIERIAKDFMGARASGHDAAGRLLGLRTTMYGSVGPQASGKLLLVRANGRGLPSLTASRGRAEVKLEVGIMERKEKTVAFKFLKHTNAAGSTVPVTVNSPGNAQEWVHKLNWIFGAQANVYFKPIATDWVSIGRPVAQPMTAGEFKQSIVPHKHATADLTCFLVGKYKGDEHGTEAAGTYFPDHKVCVLDDGPVPGIFDDSTYDSFIGVMAHEFAHFLGGGHHNRGRFLMSNATETLELDKQLVIQLNHW